MGRVICVSSQKGGVGKTTTSVNLSTAFAVAEKTCLLVDCDPQGHATQGVDTIHRCGKGTLYQAMMGKVPIREVVVPTNLSFLHVLPAGMELLQAEADLPRMPEKESRLKSLLAGLKNDYDYVLVDTPPGVGLLAINGLVAADSVLIPLQCEFYAFSGLKNYLRFIAVVKEHLNPFLQLEGILLNMLVSEQVLSEWIAEQAKRCLGEWVFGSVIPRERDILESTANGRPLLLQNMTSSCSVRYLALAGEIMCKAAMPDLCRHTDFAALAKSAVKGSNWREYPFAGDSLDSHVKTGERGVTL